jgi:hypothetical protein
MDAPKRHAANCKWARPTLQEADPVWLLAEERPWTCVLDGVPRVLESTEACEDCPHWEPLEMTPPPEA